jgi:hypothetical protein
MHAEINLRIDLGNAIRIGFGSASEYVRVANSPLPFAKGEKIKVSGC